MAYVKGGESGSPSPPAGPHGAQGLPARKAKPRRRANGADTSAAAERVRRAQQKKAFLDAEALRKAGQRKAAELKAAADARAAESRRKAWAAELQGGPERSGEVASTAAPLVSVASGRTPTVGPADPHRAEIESPGSGASKPLLRVPNVVQGFFEWAASRRERYESADPERRRVATRVKDTIVSEGKDVMEDVSPMAVNTLHSMKQLSPRFGDRKAIDLYDALRAGLKYAALHPSRMLGLFNPRGFEQANRDFEEYLENPSVEVRYDQALAFDGGLRAQMAQGIATAVDEMFTGRSAAELDEAYVSDEYDAAVAAAGGHWEGRDGTAFLERYRRAQQNQARAVRELIDQAGGTDAVNQKFLRYLTAYYVPEIRGDKAIYDFESGEVRREFLRRGWTSETLKNRAYYRAIGYGDARTPEMLAEFDKRLLVAVDGRVESYFDGADASLSWEERFQNGEFAFEYGLKAEHDYEEWRKEAAAIAEAKGGRYMASYRWGVAWRTPGVWLANVADWWDHVTQKRFFAGVTFLTTLLAGDDVTDRAVNAAAEFEKDTGGRGAAYRSDNVAHRVVAGASGETGFLSVFNPLSRRNLIGFGRLVSSYSPEQLESLYSMVYAQNAEFDRYWDRPSTSASAMFRGGARLAQATVIDADLLGFFGLKIPLRGLRAAAGAADAGGDAARLAKVGGKLADVAHADDLLKVAQRDVEWAERAMADPVWAHEQVSLRGSLADEASGGSFVGNVIAAVAPGSLSEHSAKMMARSRVIAAVSGRLGARARLMSGLLKKRASYLELANTLGRLSAAVIMTDPAAARIALQGVRAGQSVVDELPKRMASTIRFFSAGHAASRSVLEMNLASVIDEFVRRSMREIATNTKVIAVRGTVSLLDRLGFGADDFLDVVRVCLGEETTALWDGADPVAGLSVAGARASIDARHGTGFYDKYVAAFVPVLREVFATTHADLSGDVRRWIGEFRSLVNDGILSDADVVKYLGDLIWFFVPDIDSSDGKVSLFKIGQFVGEYADDDGRLAVMAERFVDALTSREPGRIVSAYGAMASYTRHAGYGEMPELRFTRNTDCFVEDPARAGHYTDEIDWSGVRKNIKALGWGDQYFPLYAREARIAFAGDLTQSPLFGYMKPREGRDVKELRGEIGSAKGFLEAVEGRVMGATQWRTRVAIVDEYIKALRVTRGRVFEHRSGWRRGFLSDLERELSGVDRYPEPMREISDIGMGIMNGTEAVIDSVNELWRATLDPDLSRSVDEAFLSVRSIISERAESVRGFVSEADDMIGDLYLALGLANAPVEALAASAVRRGFGPDSQVMRVPHAVVLGLRSGISLDSLLDTFELYRMVGGDLSQLTDDLLAGFLGQLSRTFGIDFGDMTATEAFYALEDAGMFTDERLAMVPGKTFFADGETATIVDLATWDGSRWLALVADQADFAPDVIDVVGDVADAAAEIARVNREFGEGVLSGAAAVDGDPFGYVAYLRSMGYRLSEAQAQFMNGLQYRVDARAATARAVFDDGFVSALSSEIAGIEGLRKAADDLGHALSKETDAALLHAGREQLRVALTAVADAEEALLSEILWRIAGHGGDPVVADDGFKLMLTHNGGSYSPPMFGDDPKRNAAAFGSRVVGLLGATGLTTAPAGMESAHWLALSRVFDGVDELIRMVEDGRPFGAEDVLAFIAEHDGVIPESVVTALKADASMLEGLRERGVQRLEDVPDSIDSSAPLASVLSPLLAEMSASQAAKRAVLALDEVWLGSGMTDGVFAHTPSVVFLALQRVCSVDDLRELAAMSMPFSVDFSSLHGAVGPDEFMPVSSGGALDRFYEVAARIGATVLRAGDPAFTTTLSVSDLDSMTRWAANSLNERGVVAFGNEATMIGVDGSDPWFRPNVLGWALPGRSGHRAVVTLRSSSLLSTLDEPEPRYLVARTALYGGAASRHLRDALVVDMLLTATHEVAHADVGSSPVLGMAAPVPDDLRASLSRISEYMFFNEKEFGAESVTLVAGLRSGLIDPDVLVDGQRIGDVGEALVAHITGYQGGAFTSSSGWVFGSGSAAREWSAVVDRATAALTDALADPRVSGYRRQLSAAEIDEIFAEMEEAGFFGSDRSTFGRFSESSDTAIRLLSRTLEATSRRAELTKRSVGRFVVSRTDRGALSPLDRRPGDFDTVEAMAGGVRDRRVAVSELSDARVLEARAYQQLAAMEAVKKSGETALKWLADADERLQRIAESKWLLRRAIAGPLRRFLTEHVVPKVDVFYRDLRVMVLLSGSFVSGNARDIGLRNLIAGVPARKVAKMYVDWLSTVGEKGKALLTRPAQQSAELSRDLPLVEFGRHGGRVEIDDVRLKRLIDSGWALSPTGRMLGVIGGGMARDVLDGFERGTGVSPVMRMVEIFSELGADDLEVFGRQALLAHLTGELFFERLEVELPEHLDLIHELQSYDDPLKVNAVLRDSSRPEVRALLNDPVLRDLAGVSRDSGFTGIELLDMIAEDAFAGAFRTTMFTHFDYENLSPAMRMLKRFFMFPVYGLNNVRYWGHLGMKYPNWIARLHRAYEMQFYQIPVNDEWSVDVRYLFSGNKFLQPFQTYGEAKGMLSGSPADPRVLFRSLGYVGLDPMPWFTVWASHVGIMDSQSYRDGIPLFGLLAALSRTSPVVRDAFGPSGVDPSRFADEALVRLLEAWVPEAVADDSKYDWYNQYYWGAVLRAEATGHGGGDVFSMRSSVDYSYEEAAQQIAKEEAWSQAIYFLTKDVMVRDGWWGPVMMNENEYREWERFTVGGIKGVGSPFSDKDAARRFYNTFTGRSPAPQRPTEQRIAIIRVMREATREYESGIPPWKRARDQKLQNLKDGLNAMMDARPDIYGPRGPVEYNQRKSIERYFEMLDAHKRELADGPQAGPARSKLKERQRNETLRYLARHHYVERFLELAADDPMEVAWGRYRAQVLDPAFARLDKKDADFDKVAKKAAAERDVFLRRLRATGYMPLADEFPGLDAYIAAGATPLEKRVRAWYDKADGMTLKQYLAHYREAPRDIRLVVDAYRAEKGKKPLSAIGSGGGGLAAWAKRYPGLATMFLTEYSTFDAWWQAYRALPVEEQRKLNEYRVKRGKDPFPVGSDAPEDSREWAYARFAMRYPGLKELFGGRFASSEDWWVSYQALTEDEQLKLNEIRAGRGEGPLPVGTAAERTTFAEVLAAEWAAAEPEAAEFMAKTFPSFRDMALVYVRMSPTARKLIDRKRVEDGKKPMAELLFAVSQRPGGSWVETSGFNADGLFETDQYGHLSGDAEERREELAYAVDPELKGRRDEWFKEQSSHSVEGIKAPVTVVAPDGRSASEKKRRARKSRG